MQNSQSSLNPTVSDSDLSELEVDAIDLFVRIAQLIGTSKSIGEIYGLLFISTSPVSVEDVRTKLRLSSGSASQGLRILRNVGAARAIYVAGDRRDYYVAETGLRKIAAGFLREKVVPHLIDQEDRIAHLGQLLSSTPKSQREVLEERIETLKNWRKQAGAVLPLVMNGLEMKENAEGTSNS